MTTTQTPLSLSIDDATRARNTSGWVMVTLMFGSASIVPCNSRDEAYRLWRECSGVGMAATVLFDGLPA